jgi:hypothetical protein
MLRKMKGEAGLVPAGLVAGLMAASLLVAPAQAHEWLQGRRALPYPYAAHDPSDRNAEVSALRYRSVTLELRSFRPVDPLPWGEVNKRVAPAPRTPPGTEKGR